MDIHSEIKFLHKNKKYSELVVLCSNMDKEDYTEWDYFYFVNGLYQLKHYDMCLKIFRDEFHKKFPCSKIINKLVAWALYKHNLKNFDFSNLGSNIFLKQVDYVLNTLSDKEDVQDSLLRWLVVDLIIEHLGTDIKTPNVLQLTNHYLDAVNPSNLPKDTTVIKLENGRMIEMASAHEIWFSKKSKCLIALEMFEECVKICDEALNIISKFHYNNDSWFRYRKAQSLFRIGEVVEAKLLVMDILKSNFKHWCLYSLLYQIACKESDKDSALKNAGLCALCDNSHEMRIAFYSELGKYLESLSEYRLAQLHFQLVALIKRENKWKLKATDVLPKEKEILSMTKREVLKELSAFWKLSRSIGVKYYAGKVTRMLPNGKSGFVLNQETGKQHYFSMKDVADRSILNENVLVRFTLIERMDRKKGVPSLCAVDITVNR